MKKFKKICRSIIVFLLIIGISIVPTLIFRTRDEVKILFRKPEYWAISILISVIITWQVVQDMNNSKK